MIGIGIDRDVTYAAIKAIRDVMDRNACFDDYDKRPFDSQHKKLYIQLGVPTSSLSNNTDIDQSIVNANRNIHSTVNLAHLLHQLFPNRCHQQLTPCVYVQMGGLNVQSPSCTKKSSDDFVVERKVVVVAHLFFANDEEQQGSTATKYSSQQHLPSWGAHALKQDDCALTGGATWNQNVTSPAQMDLDYPLPMRQHQSTVTATHTRNNVSQASAEGNSHIGYKHGFHASTVETLDVDKNGMVSSAASNLSYDVNNVAPIDSPGTISMNISKDTYSSIDMLARISASIIDDEKHDGNSVLNSDARLQGTTKNFRLTIAKDQVKSFKQRPLPVSSKTTERTRHFVQHSYKDLSQEIPPMIYESRAENIAGSITFPMKLHDALSQIQNDKKDHIFGWLPHGRSFKIHYKYQHEFAANVLPQYFVMTKKSSFLRQLNLYGFRRISDGSYYHERFLRGMKYLCLSMVRLKVNGNGVRAAGNPDEEPNLSDYPSCPPSTISQPEIQHATMEQRTDIESLASNPEHVVHGEDQIVSNESGSSVNNDDRAARSDSGSNSDNSTSDCNVEFDCAMKPVVSSSSSPNIFIFTDPEIVKNSLRPDTFPVKLQRILDEMEQDGQTDIISWLPTGHAFMIHDVERFTQEILPLHFNHTKYASFLRQLHMYHITRIARGPDKGAYQHNLLLRGRPELSKRVKRCSTTATITTTPV